MGVIEYAKQILKDHGCNEYTYGGCNSQHVLDDLIMGYPDGMKYPYLCVANAILSISRPEPIIKKPFMMIWDTEDCSDGIECNSFEEAKMLLEDCFMNWKMDKILAWENYFPTEKQIEDWDYMIYNCGCQIYKYDFETDEYEEYYYPSGEELRKIGWGLWEDVKEMYRISWKEVMK